MPNFISADELFHRILSIIEAEVDTPVNKSVYNGYGGEQFSMKMQPKPQRGGQPKLRIIPIGGVGEMGIGKNMTVIQYKNEAIVIDMGVLFAGDDYPGVNYMVPDIKYLEDNLEKVSMLSLYQRKTHDRQNP